LEKDAGISPTHWLATVRPDGRPHVMPVWAIWVDDAFYFVTGTTTRSWILFNWVELFYNTEAGGISCELIVRSNFDGISKW
jgi:hypothetical protein